MKTVFGLFDNYEDASDAVGELEARGISHDDISIVASNSTNWFDEDASKAADDAASGAGLGAVVGGAGGLLTGLGIMAIPGVGPVVAAGWLAATAVGALGGAVVGGAAGGIVGALKESGVPERDAHVYAESLRRGGTLVTARVEDDLVLDAEEILSETNTVNVEELRNRYQADGWTEFDAEAENYTPEEIARDRARTADRP